MKTVRLGDYIEEQCKKNKKGEDIPVFSVTNTNGFCTEYFNKDVSSKDKSNYKIVYKGFFAYNPSRINVGSVDWLRNEDKVIVSPLYNVFSVSPELEKQYLYYFLKSERGKTLITSKAEGSVRDNLKFSILSDFPIPLPSVEEQRNFVAKLDKSNELIIKYKRLLEYYDTLIKSRFIEMFGDPEINQKNFPLETIQDVIDFHGGSQPAKKYFEYQKTKDNIRLIQIRDYKSDRFITYIPKSLAKRYCSKDDIMIGRYGPPIFQILQGIEGSYNVALMKAIPKKGNKEFIRYFLKQESLLHYLESFSTRTAGQDGIQMDKLLSYPFPYPPIDLQNDFAAFVQQIDKSKFEIWLTLQNYGIIEKRVF